MHVARELKLTLSELAKRITVEELQLWAAFFEIERDELEKARRNR